MADMSGATSGAAAGASFGPWGALAGGVIGGLLGKKGQKQSQTTESSPWGPQQPYLLSGFDKAKNFLNAPGSTVAPFSSLTTEGINLGRQFAGALPSLTAPATGALNFALTQAANPGSNPYLPGLVQAAINPVEQKLFNEWLPQINSAFINSGQGTGTPQYIKSLSPIISQATRDITDATTRLGADVYGQGLNVMSRGLDQAPGILQLGMDPSNILLALGQQEQGQAQAQLDEPLKRLQAYMGLVGGNYGQSSTSTINDPSQVLKGLLGGGMLGYNLAK